MRQPKDGAPGVLGPIYGDKSEKQLWLGFIEATECHAARVGLLRDLASAVYFHGGTQRKLWRTSLY